MDKKIWTENSQKKKCKWPKKHDNYTSLFIIKGKLNDMCHLLDFQNKKNLLKHRAKRNILKIRGKQIYKMNQRGPTTKYLLS